MPELLLELFSEEIPARMQAKAGEDLARLLTEAFDAAGLKTQAPFFHTGPRRLAVVFPDLAERTEAVREEKKGPRVGAPEKAVEGFLKSAGLTALDQCEKRSDAKGEFYVAIIEKPGRDTRDLLGEIVPAACNEMPWPKSMRWAARSERWVRPLQRIICLFGGQIAPVEWAGIKAGDQTEGHRVHGKGPFKVTDFASYKSTLETQGHVLIDRAQRRALIADKARKLCADAGLELVEDAALLDEVAGLAEWPVPLLGEFDPAFLELPPEVIQLTMAKNQKYFAVRKPGEKGLAPRFVAIADLEPKDGGAASAKGYARVLSARLSDARFFWDEDRARTLDSRVEDLKRVVFHRKLGSVYDKAQRLADWITEFTGTYAIDEITLGKPGYELARRAALLAKADLTTAMVQEFTDLQGVMGGYYILADARSDNPPPLAGEGDHEVVEGANAAQKSPHPEEARSAKSPHPEVRSDSGASKDEGTSPAEQVARAIREHYSPLGPSDAVPTDPVSVAVALADKLDTLAAFWAIDEKPTGSKDPYALRRAALGVIRIILENNVRAGLRELLRGSVWQVRLRVGPPERREKFEQFWAAQHASKSIGDVLRDLSTSNIGFVEEAGPIVEDLVAFFADRLKVVLREEGVRHDLIDAVFNVGVSQRQDAMEQVLASEIYRQAAADGQRVEIVIQSSIQTPDDLVAIVARVRALQSFLATPEGENLLAGAKRAMNIIEAEEKKGFTAETAAFAPALLQAPEEIALSKALDAAGPQAKAAVEAEDYAAAMAAIAPLRPAIDSFFDKVTVNDPDPALRTNRLLLLTRIRDAIGAVADFSKIGG